jgi:Helix-turn-helix domain
VLLDADDPLSEALTLDQAAEATGRSVATIRRWIRAGRLRCLLGHYVVERELLAVEAERHRAAHRGRPGVRFKVAMPDNHSSAG